jgi:hypothetical protein
VTDPGLEKAHIAHVEERQEQFGYLTKRLFYRSEDGLRVASKTFLGHLCTQRIVPGGEIYHKFYPLEEL